MRVNISFCVLVSEFTFNGKSKVYERGDGLEVRRGQSCIEPVDVRREGEML